MKKYLIVMVVLLVAAQQSWAATVALYDADSSPTDPTSQGWTEAVGGAFGWQADPAGTGEPGYMVNTFGAQEDTVSISGAFASNALNALGFTASARMYTDGFIEAPTLPYALRFFVETGSLDLTITFSGNNDGSFYRYASDGNLTSVGTIPDNTDFHDYAVEYDPSGGGSVKYYVDGGLVTTVAANLFQATATDRIGFASERQPTVLAENRGWINEVKLDATIIPEPASLVLLALGALCLVPRKRR